MKKTILYIVVVSLIMIVATGATYAFFSASATSDEGLLGGANKLEVIYTGDTAINGNLKLVSTKEEGYIRQVSIKLSDRSVGASSNIYIKVEKITANVAIDALKWEIYGFENNIQIYHNSGTFTHCGELDEPKSKCTNGDKIYMVNNHVLSTTPTEFVVYLWLNGEEADNNVLGGTLIGYIGAESQNVTGIME